MQITRSSPIVRSPRVLQLEGMFDVPPSSLSEQRWNVDLPLAERPWNIGLIAGPSGCGKSTIARALFGNAVTTGFDWPANRSLVDLFPASMGIKEIVGLLSSVGFSSPPAWMRPYSALSTGEQFRVTLARALAEQPNLVVFDEFSSVVDRTVARISSAAVARTVRERQQQFVAISCHEDIIEWLQPDWIYSPNEATSSGRGFQWRCLRRRPSVAVEIVPAHRSAWKLFEPHHYLTGQLAAQAKCYVALVEGRPAAFCAAVVMPGKITCWREHRLVCLPDYQGLGLGNALSLRIAAAYASTGRQYRAVTGHPGLIRQRLNNRAWLMVRGPTQVDFRRSRYKTSRGFTWTEPNDRATASFLYIGPPNAEAAKELGIEPRMST